VKRGEFEHTIRAAGAVLGVGEVLVIGSQALHASVPGDLPEEASRSVEADIAALEDVDGRMADLIDGAIGEASMFHSTFAYYALEFCATLKRAGLVRVAVLEERLLLVALDDRVRALVASRIQGL
jgi:hypothetical protein